uniref:peptidylprolyl isomerase n=1 Tax=Aceria tosichella TaxID=561515 RepID=A0A6G1SQ17_9ACAR
MDDDIKCYFDISIGDLDCGRIVFKLFHDKCPKTCENFRCLCTGEKGISRRFGKPLHYKGTSFHRIVKNFIIQGGDITDGNGRGGDSIYDGAFADENLTLAHDEPYLLSMANRGADTNKSQFFITTNEAPHLDGKHVVFGRVVSGLDTILKIERQEVDSKSRPLKKVIIRDCGQLLNEPSRVNQESLTATNRGRKRKLSTSSQSDSGRSPRNCSKSPSTRSASDSCSRSSSTSSTSDSSCSSSRSRHSSGRRRRRPVTCSSDSDSSFSDSSSSGSGSSTTSSQASRSAGHSSRSGSTTSKRRRRQSSPSSSDDSANSSVGRSRKRRKTNRRLESSRKIEDFNASKSTQSKHADPNDGAVPGYKCTVNLDEIPEVPVNRFLQRVPLRAGAHDQQDASAEDETIGPIEIDLSKFEDIPDEVDNDEPPKNITIPSKITVIKTNEPVISKSGRIMRGRGTFKFRTPSPEQRATSRDNFRKSNDHYNDNRRSSRWDRNRSHTRDGRGSPQYRSSRRETSNSRRR